MPTESFIVKNGERDNDEPSGFCCLTVSSFSEYNNTEAIVYSEENVLENSVKHLRREEQEIDDILKINISMRPLTEVQRCRMATTTHCECCEKKF